MEIITRSAAIRAGLKKYFTGEPCKNGHLAERYVQSCTCELCIRGDVPNSIVSPKQPSQVSLDRLAIDRLKADAAALRARVAADNVELNRQRSETAALRAKVASDRLDLTRQKAAQRLVERAETVVTREQKAEQRVALKATRSELVAIDIKIHNDDYEMFRESLLAISRLTDPSIQLFDLIGKHKPRISGAEKIYRICIFHTDEADIRQLEEAFLVPRQEAQEKKRKALMDERTKAILADIDAEAAKRIPEFRP